MDVGDRRCRDQQEDVLRRTEVWSRHEHEEDLGEGEDRVDAGSPSGICSQTSDCYGDAICKRINSGSTNKVCVCPMFSVREHHSVSVQYRYKHVATTTNDNESGMKNTSTGGNRTTTLSESLIYVVGGFTNVRQKFCAGRACGYRGSYRMALDDAWVSSNGGAKWIQLRPASGTTISGAGGGYGYKSRGAHSSFLMHANLFRNPKDTDRLWIIGGESVDPNLTSSEYLNDIWMVNLSTEPCCLRTNSCNLPTKHIGRITLDKSDIGQCLPALSDWKRNNITIPWSGKAGQIAIHEPPSSLNAFKDFIYVVGGRNESVTTSEVWSFDASNADSAWNLDFSRETLNGGNTLTATHISNNGGMAANSTITMPSFQFHYDMNSKLETLVQVQLPVTKWLKEDQFVSPNALPIFKSQEIANLRDVGLITFMDLHSIDQRTLLHTRDFIKDICYVKALISAFETKCSMEVVKPSRGDDVHKTPSSCRNLDNEEECIVEKWDGCSSIEGYQYINVHGIGSVRVPTVTHDFSSDLENMFCKQTPGSRYMAAGLYADAKVLILGGQGSNPNVLYRDVWSRDDSTPLATIKTKPKSDSSQSTFLFECDEDGALQFEYKIFDFTERLDVTPWLPAINNEPVDVSWLDSKKGGPGSSLYTLYLRAGENNMILNSPHIRHHSFI